MAMLEDGMKITKFLNSIPYGRYNHVRRELWVRSETTANILTHYIAGRTPIPDKVKKAMNHVAKEYTGTNIF